MQEQSQRLRLGLGPKVELLSHFIISGIQGYKRKEIVLVQQIWI